MLKERDIAVLFEDEKINILTMDDELLLVVLSSRCTTRSRKYIC
ncbi:hypothetical protein ACFFHH_16095 [Cytobacillus solani]